MRKKNKIILFSFVIILIGFSVLRYSNITGNSIDDNQYLEELKTLAYLNYVKDEQNIDKKNVTIYDKELISDGINIFTSDDKCEAYLMDMEGNILHKWSSKLNNKWDFVKINNNGDIIAIADPAGKNHKLISLDWDSNIKWMNNESFHHDIEITNEGNIFSIILKKINTSRGKIASDYIVFLSPEGKIKKEISVYELVKDNKIVKKKLQSENFHDLLHTNSIKIIDKNIFPIAKKGDLLITIRNINLIIIVDIENEKIIWEWGQNNLDMPHDSRLLDNGNILIFDNGWHRGYSRIIELNPITKEIVWEYTGDPKESFFTKERGGNQRLPNGNTLITESEKGRVFEVTKKGKIVWEWFNPFFTEDNKRSTLYRMNRLDKNKVKELLND
jgi:hypothetical protein